MSSFPTSLDDDSTLPRVDDNITEIGADAINALRDAVFNIEAELGLGASGTTGSIANRLTVSLDGQGHIRPSAIASMGLVVLPIVNSQVSATAAIQESKIDLAFSTTFLNSRIDEAYIDIKTSLDFITNHGFKIEPHIQGTGFRHFMSHIDVAPNSLGFFRNFDGGFRNNTNLYEVFNDLNNDYIKHQVANGQNVTLTNGLQTGGTVPPDNYAHVSTGIFLDTNNFSFIPQTAIDLQQFAQFIDNSNIFIIGTRIQALYSNGISRFARASILQDLERGQLIVPVTPATAYLLHNGNTSPVDNIDNGDDIIEFNPSAGSISTSSFDAAFSRVKVGDNITVEYPAFTVKYVIREKKYTVAGPDKRYIVRIDGKNITASAVNAYVNRPLANDNKTGVLALAQAHNIIGVLPSLVVGNARGAEVLGIGFDASGIDSTHYNLFIAYYPNGNPASQVINLPAIDISGNQGLTPGKYSLSSIVENINNQFRTPGYNNRFMAFSYQGELGIKMTDPVNNCSFTILDGVVATTGLYDQTASNTLYPNNVIGIPGFDIMDALGFGLAGSGISSPAFASTYATAEASLTPAKIQVPLTRKNFYVNGVERERFELEPGMSIDGYGEGFWAATIITRTSIPGSRVEVTYRVPLDLSNSHLQIGKTITVVGGTSIDTGRFIINDVQFNSCHCDDAYTDITVYDAIQSPTGTTPSASAAVNTTVSLYFSSGDSVGFNIENVSDDNTVSPFKRHMEIFINQDGYTFSHERARMNISGSVFDTNSVPLYCDAELTPINIYKVSPKLRGYGFGKVTKINLQIDSFNTTTGIYSGKLAKFDGTLTSNAGPTTIGKKGEVTRFYDETYVDFIDFVFNVDEAVANISGTKKIDVQVFPTLSLDEEIMLIGTVQVNDTLKKLTYLRDERTFGNVSEKNLTTSALNFISAPEKLLSENGVIRGFDLITDTATTINLKGGTALVDGKIVEVGSRNINVPALIEVLSPGFTTRQPAMKYYLCLNSSGEYELLASTDYAASLSSTYGALDHNRIFYVINPNAGSPTQYAIPSGYLQKILWERHDLLPLYIVTANVALVGSTYVNQTFGISSIRRYIEKGYRGLAQRFTVGDQASYRTMSEIINTITEITSSISFSSVGNTLGNKVYVKGNLAAGGSNFNFPTKMQVIGDGGSLTIDSLTSTGNVNFRDLIINVSSAIGFELLGSNVSWENCTFNYTYDATADGSFTSSHLSNIDKACIYGSTALFSGSSENFGIKNIQIKNCIFNSEIQNRFSFVSLVIATENAYLEKIFIDNNIVNTLTTLSTTDDKRAAFSIACSSNTSSTAVTSIGPRVVNSMITNNKCNKNQLILFSGQTNGASQVANTLVPIGVSISNNVCGAICFLVRGDRANNIVNTDIRVNDKDNILNISGNSCKFIYCGTNIGFINVIGSVNRVIHDIISGADIYSGSVIIDKNTCSWIQVGVKNPTTYAFETPIMEISSNKLTASNPAFLTSYHSVITPSNIALIVDSVIGT